MEKHIEKRLTTQTQVCMEVEEVEQIIRQHVGINSDVDIEWHVSQDCVDRVTITATEECEVE